MTKAPRFRKVTREIYRVWENGKCTTFNSRNEARKFYRLVLARYKIQQSKENE